MTLILRSKTYHLRRRVPLRFRDVEPREFVTISLHTDSPKEAESKAKSVWNTMLEGWQAQLDGAASTGKDRLKAAKLIAQHYGRTYHPAVAVAEQPIREIVERVEAAVTPKGLIKEDVAEALLGAHEDRSMPVSEALKSFWVLDRAKERGKSADQIRRARNPRIKAIRNFIDVIGDKPYLEVTTQDLFRFRTWWIERAEEQGLTVNSINKDLVHVTSTLRVVARSEGKDENFKTAGLSLREEDAKTRPPFSTTWIKARLLDAEALAGLNDQARAIMWAMVNTGCRPSEIAALTRDQIILDGDVPHISIEPVGRKLKTANARRTIPLTGISLKAFQEFPEGFSRYIKSSAALSATVNKYLRENGLLETEGHSLYSLRHAFEDRMLHAKFDERIRRDLMGHALGRERYGAGGRLPYLHSLLQKIAL